jgi:protein-S-isoprenylcysteine O-methyltransferase Ste14
MGLRDELERQGNWPFRRRNHLPLITLPVLLVAVRETNWLERFAGETLKDSWDIFCLGISLIGLTIRLITVGHAPAGTSGRNTKSQKATVLNTSGMYSIVRHPLYLGNFIIILGLILLVSIWWFGLIAILAFWLYNERIIAAEEKFLEEKFGNRYLDWAEKTPAILPRFHDWQPPSLPFSMRNALEREYSGFFLIIACFALLDVGEDAFCGKWESNWGSLMLFIVGLIAYFTLRALKKNTMILDVEGR